MNINDFERKLLAGFQQFVNRAKKHPEINKRDFTYADWFDTFRAHEEVGTELEIECHGKRELNVHGPVCDLCASSLNMNNKSIST